MKAKRTNNHSIGGRSLAVFRTCAAHDASMATRQGRQNATTGALFITHLIQLALGPLPRPVAAKQNSGAPTAMFPNHFILSMTPDRDVACKNMHADLCAPHQVETTIGDQTFMLAAGRGTGSKGLPVPGRHPEGLMAPDWAASVLAEGPSAPCTPASCCALALGGGL